MRSIMAALNELNMDRQMILDHLEIAERHVSQGILHVERQRQIVAELARDGLPTALSKAILARFEELLAVHIVDRDRLLRLREST